MRILVDENIPLTTVEKLRSLGHDVVDIRGTDEEGLSDELIWNKAVSDNRLFITTDKGFVNYRDKKHYGILIITLRKPNRNAINKHIIDAFQHYSEEQWQGLLVVMRDKAMSIWKVIS